VAVGAFNGVHAGHRQVLRCALAQAADGGGSPAVLTFDRHPLSLVAPGRAPLALTSVAHRTELFASVGIEVVAVMPFDEKLRQMTPSLFAVEVLADGLGARAVVVGEDFRFGGDRAGDVEALRTIGRRRGFGVFEVSLVGDGEPLSSTRIRGMIAGGDVLSASAALGRPHEVWGEVVPGDGRGRTIGVPTANIAVAPGTALPAIGVYVVTVGREADEVLPAVANMGVRPTFGPVADPVLEAHILDVDLDLYGSILRVRFVDRIREERTFEGPAALVAQISDDIRRAHDILTLRGY